SISTWEAPLPKRNHRFKQHLRSPKPLQTPLKKLEKGSANRQTTNPAQSLSNRRPVYSVFFVSSCSFPPSVMRTSFSILLLVVAIAPDAKAQVAATEPPPGVLPAMSRAQIEAGLKAHDRALYIKQGWIRDPYIKLGPDDCYYLTGTTPNPNDPREQ